MFSSSRSHRMRWDCESYGGGVSADRPVGLQGEDLHLDDG